MSQGKTATMEKLIRRINFRDAGGGDAQHRLRQEWLVTNGLGGYASGTISGAVTWRYHGLLIAALPAPLGRTVMLNHLDEWLRFPDGRMVQIAGAELSEKIAEGTDSLVEFRLENHIPHWRYGFEDVVLEKRVVMP